LEESYLPGRKAFMFRKSNFHLHKITGAENTLGPSEPAYRLRSVAPHTATPGDLSLYQIRKIAYGALQFKAIALVGNREQELRISVKG
jgi:hypothetical protein